MGTDVLQQCMGMTWVQMYYSNVWESHGNRCTIAMYGNDRCTAMYGNDMGFTPHGFLIKTNVFHLGSNLVQH